MHHFKMALFLAAASIAAASPAEAANYNLTLTGAAPALTVTPFAGGTQGFLALNGLDTSNAITVNQGDTIVSTVQLNGLITIPAATGSTVVDDLFTGLGFDGSDVAVTDTINFYNNGTLVGSYTGNATTNSMLASGIFLGAGTSLTFDSYIDNLTITELATPTVLNAAYFTYDQFNATTPAPEPATWMLTIAGMGVVGGVMRRRSRQTLAMATA